MKRGDPLAIVEAAYDAIDAPKDAWLRAIANAAAPLDAGFGAFAALFDASGPTEPTVDGVFSDGTSADAMQANMGAYAHMPLPQRFAMCEFGCAFASERIPEPALTAMRGSAPMSASRLHDALGVVGVDASKRGVILALPMYERRLPRGLPRSLWRKTASHLATAARLRRRRQALRREPDAVMLPGGLFLHGTGDATTTPARDTLTSAARQIDRARTRTSRADPARALALWTALVSGRWSLVDTIESDGKRLLVAHRNDAPGLAVSASLTARESQVAALVAGGRSNKEIAYELGIGVSTVETLVLRARRKLGAGSRASLAASAASREALAAPRRAQAP